MRMKNRLFLTLLLIVALITLLGIACSTSNEQTKDGASEEKEKENTPEQDSPKENTGDASKAPGEFLHSKVSRELKPEVAGADALLLSQGNRDFALSLYHTLRTEKPAENLFFSPHSITSALAMAYGGARGETASEMARAMHFTLAPEVLHPAFNSLSIQLDERSKVEAQEGGGDPFQLHVVNAIWGQKDYSFTAGYLDLLARNYGAGLRVMDFVGQAEPSREQINAWVEEQTRDRIKNLLPPGSIDADTRLVLTNAIYFKAGWLREFHESSTVQAPFHLLDGSTAEVSQMRQMAHFPYAAGANYQVIELPYIGNEVSMVVLLPNTGALESFEDSLHGERFAELLGGLKVQNGTIQLPKFSFESSFSLNEPLERLGMKQAFTRQADFSGMDGTQNLSISAIVHKSFVAVDEEGTEAAAATAVSMGTTSMPMVNFEMTVDRPFLFVIYDKPTQTMLFIGRVVDPR